MGVALVSHRVGVALVSHRVGVALVSHRVGVALVSHPHVWVIPGSLKTYSGFQSWLPLVI